MLKALVLRQKIDAKKKALEALRTALDGFKTRETELEAAIAEAAGEDVTDEDRAALDAEIDAFETDKKKTEDDTKALEDEIRELEKELDSLEAKQEARSQNPAPKHHEEENTPMNTRAKIFAKMSMQERSALFAREDVKNYLQEVRSCIREKRALTNVGLTIPEVFLGLLRQNIEDYSKLYKHCTVRAIGGDGRLVVMGSIPEGVWTECCANLNELSLGFNDAEVDCFKVGGFFKVCNAVLEDSDIDLAGELLTAIGQAIGFALDKAILYGRNAAGTAKMPQGIVSRLVQTSQPDSYPATARPWVDLHTTNVLTIANTVTGIDLFKTIMIDSAVIKGKYARGEKVWVMNETTYTWLKAQAMSINAAGAIVSGLEGTMPVIGGIVEVLDFVPNYVIIGGYFELYLLAERAGQRFAQSEHAFFIADQTAFKGTARYDGTPVIAEAFAAIGVNGTSPNATMSFAPDTANTVDAIVLSKSSVTLAASASTKVLATTLAAGIPKDATVTWATSASTYATVSSTGVITGVAAGSAVITATAGDASAVVNVTVTSA